MRKLPKPRMNKGRRVDLPFNLHFYHWYIFDIAVISMIGKLEN